MDRMEIKKKKKKERERERERKRPSRRLGNMLRRSLNRRAKETYWKMRRIGVRMIRGGDTRLIAAFTLTAHQSRSTTSCTHTHTHAHTVLLPHARSGKEKIDETTKFSAGYRAE